MKEKAHYGAIIRALLKAADTGAGSSVDMFEQRALRYLGWDNYEGRARSIKTYYLSTMMQQLKDKGHLKFVDMKGQQFPRLTRRGKKLLMKRRLQEHHETVPRRKDEEWHVVIYDVKEKRRSVRDSMRRELIAAGFIQLQRSVWISPYDQEELLALLKIENRIGKDFLYLHVRKIENDTQLRRMFGFP